MTLSNYIHEHRMSGKKEFKEKHVPMSIIQMRKLRLRKAESPGQVYTASSGFEPKLNS